MARISPFARFSLPCVLAAALMLACCAKPALPQIDLDSLRFTPIPHLINYAEDVAVGDFDGDGFSDIAALGGDGIEIYLQDGANRFVEQGTLVPVDDYRDVEDILTGDFDTDGFIDLAIGQTSPYRVDIFAGDGAGGFVLLRTIADLAASPFNGVATDFDGDGHLDLVYGSGLILLGDGAGDFTALPRVFLPGPESLQVADFDENGHNDLAVLSGGQDFIFPVLADTSGALVTGLVPTPAPTSIRAEAVAGDFDEDGNPDVAVDEWILFGNGSGGFGAPIASPALVNRIATSAVDIDGDGHLDIIAREFAKFRMLLGDGTGNFTVGDLTPLVATDHTPVAADFNGDGILDLAASDKLDDYFFVLLGTGGGSFASPLVFSTPTDYDDVAAGDVDGDTVPDLVLIADDRFAVYYGDGSGDFPTHMTFPTGGNQHLATADFNEDGFVDLAIAFHDDVTKVFLNDTAGGFVEHQALTMMNRLDLVTADLDADGHSDLVSISITGGLTVAKGTGTGSFVDVTTHPTSYRPRGVGFADFDGSGLVDIVVANLESIHVLPNQGNGTFSSVPAVAAQSPVDLAAADLDGDGHLDLVTANSEPDTLTVYAGDGLGGFVPAASYPTVEAPERLHLADLDRDGKVDAAVTGEGGMEIRFGDPTGALTDSRHVSLESGGARSLHEVTVPSNPSSGVFVAFDRRGVTVRLDGREPLDGSVLPSAPASGELASDSGLAKADLNGDSHLDVIHADPDDSVVVFLGDGSGGFTLGSSTTVSNHGTIATADFDEDGNADVVIGQAGNIRVLLGDGNGNLALGASVSTELTPSAIEVGDVDLDGHVDVVVAAPGDPRPGPAFDGYVWVFLGDGTGAFPGAIPVDGVLEPHDIAIGSFDDQADDLPDILIVDHEVGGVTFARGDGTGAFVRGPSFPIGNPAPISIAVADLDRDGHLDVVVSGEESEARFGSGFGTFPEALPLDGEGTVRARDLNGDRQVDLVFAGNGTIALGNGRGDFSPPLQWFPEVSNSEAGAVTTGFFDGDGLIDVVILGNDAIRFHRNRSFELEQCVLGNADALTGVHTDLLDVNGSTGTPRRLVTIESTDGLRVGLDRAPNAAAGGNYYAAVWNGAPQASTTAMLPAGLGFACLQPIRTEPGYVIPIHVANTIRPGDPRLEPPGPTATGASGSELPAIVIDVSAAELPPVGTFLTVQALVGDRNALGRKLVSISNAVVVRIE